jgi:hypothetical protein
MSFARPISSSQQLDREVPLGHIPHLGHSARLQVSFDRRSPSAARGEQGVRFHPQHRRPHRRRGEGGNGFAEVVKGVLLS